MICVPLYKNLKLESTVAKKSDARKKRDEKGIPPNRSNPHQAADAEDKALAALDAEMNTCWDDLHKTYHQALTAFAGMGLLGRSLKNDELLSHVTDRRAFIDHVNLIKHDMGTLQAELDAIFAQHKDRRGGKAGGQDLFAAIEISELYEQWSLRYDGLISRNLNEVMAMTGEAEKRMHAARAAAAAAAQAQQAQADLTDPSVVSDVSFNEVPANQE